jgi:hypothetical protein
MCAHLSVLSPSFGGGLTLARVEKHRQQVLSGKFAPQLHT